MASLFLFSIKKINIYCTKTKINLSLRRFLRLTVTSTVKSFFFVKLNSSDSFGRFLNQRDESHYINVFFKMAKQVEVYIKLQVKGGQANPAPPIGPALGSKGVNIMEFCKRFNAATQDSIGKILPVIISVYKDKSFEFQIKTPPAAIQLLEAAKVKEGSKQPNRVKVGKVSWDQVPKIS